MGSDPISARRVGKSNGNKGNWGWKWGLTPFSSQKFSVTTTTRGAWVEAGSDRIWVVATELTATGMSHEPSGSWSGRQGVEGASEPTSKNGCDDDVRCCGACR